MDGGSGTAAIRLSSEVKKLSVVLASSMGGLCPSAAENSDPDPGALTVSACTPTQGYALMLALLIGPVLPPDLRIDHIDLPMRLKVRAVAWRKLTIAAEDLQFVARPRGT